MARESGIKIVAQNKKARHEYELLEFFEAGIMLIGPEVKSVRAGKVNFKDGYVQILNGEAWLIGVHIAPYANAGMVEQNPDRDKKLLLHAEEIEKLQARSEQKGLSIVPVKLYLKNGRAKVEIALGKGKKLHDKREDIKEKDLRREAAREAGRY